MVGREVIGVGPVQDVQFRPGRYL